MDLNRWRRHAAQFERSPRRPARAASTGAGNARAIAAGAARFPGWEQWFSDALKRHLPAHLAPAIEAIAECTNELIAELLKQAERREKLLRQHREEIHELRLETARPGSQLAELKTNQVLDAAPLAGAPRVVN
jgi:hypothetical protein